MRHILTCVVAGTAAAVVLRAVPADTRLTIAERVAKLTRESSWKLVSSVPIGFTTYHPQGMVKIGDTFFVSSVEITVPTRRLAQPVDGYDRDTGAGIGHLFKMDATGTLIADVRLGEGTMYHPGGLEYDDQNPVWIEPFDSAQGKAGGTGLRAYFMPEDDTSTLYIYEVDATSLTLDPPTSRTK